MSAQKASAPVRLAGLAAVVALAVLAVAVAFHLTGRRVPVRPPAVEPPPEGRSVDLKERVRHEEYKRGKLDADIRGDSFFLGPDGRNHLRGSVEITNFGPDGEIVSRLTAGEVVYDPGAARFTVTGGVRVEAGGVVLEGVSFDHDKEARLFGTTAGGAFSAETMSGRAAEVLYSESADEVRLAGGFRVELAAPGRHGEAAVLTGDSLVYRRRERRGLAQGRVSFSGPGFRGEAGSVSFAAAGDERAIESAAFEGGADGNARLVLRPSSGPAVDLLARTVDMSFGPGGAAGGWSAAGGFHAGFGETALEGESALFDGGARVLKAEGMPGRPAAADSPEARVEAAFLSAGPAEGDLEASGSVRCLLKPGEGRRAGGFFSAGEAALVSCDRLAFRGGAALASFAGNVRARQGEDFLDAAELEFSDAAGELRGRGGVSAGLPRRSPAEEAPDGRVELGGDEMAFSASGRVLSFKGRSRAVIPRARIEAGTISAVIGGEGEGVVSFAAKTGVVLSKGAYEGRAAAAVYQADPGRITLTGRPVLLDGKGGSTMGDKLTLNLADDKILVENEGQGRSTTVVKS
jgi:lipopolysaccharide export system protein LptA